MTRPLTRTAGLAVGLASLALLGGCAAGATPSPSGSPTPALASPAAVPSPSPVATPVPTLSAEPRWERVPDLEAFSNAEMVAVAGGPDRYVAVGRAMVGDGYAGTAWTSTDGVGWRRASAPLAGRSPNRIIHDRDGYVAWGDSAVFWTSPDGMAWIPGAATPTPGKGDAQVTGVARLGDSLVAVGYAEIEAGDSFAHEFRTWTSPDGHAWTSVSPVTSIPWDGYVNGVTAADGALVAWGYARAGEEFPPVSLRTTDGRRWEVGGVKPGAEGYMREGILDASGIGGRLVAVGHGPAGDAGSPPPPSAAWTSADGLTWKPAVLESEPATGWLLHVVWYEGEDVALGLSGLDPVVWRSVDGTTWTRSTSAPDAGRDGEAEGCAGGRCPNTVVNDLAAGPAGLVAVGRSRTATGGTNAVVWIGAAN